MKKDYTLSQRVIKGSIWIFSLRFIIKLLGLIRIIILARILTPSDFGFVGIALLTIAILETFSQTGFNAALIQKKEDIKTYLDTVWTISIIRGIILFLILFFSAPYIEIFFKMPGISPIIKIIGVSLILQSFTNVGIIYFQKELKFKKEFIYEFVGLLFDFTVAIVTAIIFKNVWALVYGLLAGNFARMFISYIIHPYRPHFYININDAQELFNFGRWILVGSILAFLLTQGDDGLVGKVLGASALGLYQMAYKISNMPVSEITHTIVRVTFPAYAKMQKNLFVVKQVFLKVLKSTALLSLPISGIIFIFAPSFTKIFFGNKWIGMVAAIQILSIYGALWAIGATPVLQSIGKPEIQTKISFIQLVILGIIIYPLTRKWGILGTSISTLISMFISVFLLITKIKNIIKFRYIEFFKSIDIPLIASLLMIVLVFLFQRFILTSTNILNFSFLLIFAIALYIFLIYILDKLMHHNFRMVFKEIMENVIK